MQMNQGTKTALAVASGVGAAALAFHHGQKAESRGDGSEYVSPWAQEVAVWGAGATLIWLGYRHKSFLITFMGAAVATLSIAQFFKKKTIQPPTVHEFLDGRIPVYDRQQLAHDQAVDVIDTEYAEAYAA